jgi:hypothetical protein
MKVIFIHFTGPDNHDGGIALHFFINKCSLIVLIFSGLRHVIPLIAI